MTELEKLQEEFDRLTVNYLRLREAYDVKHQALEHLSKKNHDLQVHLSSLKQGKDELLAGDLIYTLKMRIETLTRALEEKGND
jgi:septation ring formation regulator EzrA